jgi:hypothetical protein
MLWLFYLHKLFLRSCKPTFICGYFISWFLCDKLVSSIFAIEPSSFSGNWEKNIWFATRNICDRKVLVKLAKFSHSRIKVGLQLIVDILFILHTHLFVNCSHFITWICFSFHKNWWHTAFYSIRRSLCCLLTNLCLLFCRKLHYPWSVQKSSI